MSHFNSITLLITHYNRVNSLERLLNSFATLSISFGEIIVSDDASAAENQEKLRELKESYHFNLLTNTVNKGLGNNINKGQQAVKTPYTLYIQEDFVPCDNFNEILTNAEKILSQNQGIDMIRFYAYFKYPYLKPYKDGFSEMIFKWWYPGYKKFYMYSDHPHLRRSNFLEKFGLYTEGVKGDVTEYNMMMSFLKKGGRSMFYDNYTQVFDQINTYSEPSTMKRDFWRESDNFFITGLRHLYRHFKFNFDYLKK